MGDRTKTYSGQRNINMDSMIIFILGKAFEEFITNPNNLLFCREDGSLINEGASNSAFKRFCIKHKITKKKDINQHMLRHSFATRKIEGGMPAEVLMVIMGHKDVETTLNTYFDAFAEYKNIYEEKTYTYYEMQGLTFDIVDKNFIIKQELKSILEKIGISHLDDIEKEQITHLIENINKKYTVNEENVEKDTEEENSNIIMFPALVK